jgi:C1A family cysteine protease
MTDRTIPDLRRSNAWMGCRRDTKDARDHEFTKKAARLPKAVDLRDWCPPVMDQGELGSCTAHGITGALRTLLRRYSLSDHELSRLQLYFDERVVERDVSEDAGAEIRTGIKCAAKIGVGLEQFWPYENIMTNFTQYPPKQVYESAKPFNAMKYARVRVGARAVKNALALGFPVVIGLSLYANFDLPEVEKTGVVPMPDGKMDGGHCLYVVGYGQKPGYFTVRNSWGVDWGDKGDCYFPEEYIGSAKYGSDYWVIHEVG